MKIGTITVHNGYNYGASLQAYALVHYLRNKGFDAYLIDYRTSLIEKKTQVRPKKLFRRIFDFLTEGNGTKTKRERFDQFHSNLFNHNFCSIYSKDDLVELNNYYDAFVCGSDQIWNPRITDYDTSFFLSFAENTKKRISYAPSLGAGKIDDETFLIENLKHIESLSIRESSNVGYIERLSGRKCVSVIDPVFLLDKKSWSAIIDQQDRIIQKKYIFYYTLFEDHFLFESAKDYAKKKKLELVRLDINPLKAKMKGCRSVSNLGIGPEEFINLLSNADTVFTNSFHGTAFSIIFNKKFFVRLLDGREKEKNLRIIDLINLVGLNERIIDKVPTDTSIDWKNVEIKMNKMISFSKQYLEKSLGTKQKVERNILNDN